MSANVHYLKGCEYSEAKNYSEAIGEFTTALETEENPVIYYERALAYFHLHDNVSALRDLNTAQELDPENPFRYSSRAYVKDKMGDLEGAMEDYKIAIKLDPEDAIAQNNLGLLEEKAGFEQMAQQRFERADYIAAQQKLLENLALNGEKESTDLKDFVPVLKLEKADARKFRASDYLREIFYVFSKKAVWLEFLQFIRNRGKIGK